jgi:hypothetical protein
LKEGGYVSEVIHVDVLDIRVWEHPPQSYASYVDAYARFDTANPTLLDTLHRAKEKKERLSFQCYKIQVWGTVRKISRGTTGTTFKTNVYIAIDDLRFAGEVGSSST